MNIVCLEYSIPFLKMQSNIDSRKAMEAIFENCSADDKVVSYLFFLNGKIPHDTQQKYNYDPTSQNAIHYILPNMLLILSCFPQENITDILHEMFCWYIIMGTKQFLKDYQRDCDVQKTAAHHLHILMKKKKERQDAKISMEEMRTDSTHGRIISHKKLVAIIAQFGDSVCASSYKNSKLLTLCNACARAI